MTPRIAAIGFEPDGYSLSGPKLMGRQAAGHAFLRAAAQAADPSQGLKAWTPHRPSAQVFAQMVEHLRPGLPASWLPASRLDQLADHGLLYLPGPGIDEAARLRLRMGPQAYSLCGVTHTTASHRAMDAIKALASAPVMPWDALICTSTAVLSTVRTVLAQEADYLRWRLGAPAASPIPLPQLPVIPLGVHADDFRFDADERAKARAALGIAPDEVVALFVGRLSFHAKAHPHAMYQGLQAAARRTGRRVVLIQCGWFANDAIGRSFKDGAAASCPDVRALFTDGKDETARQRSWAAADFFVSLSDNIQETFGLTPIEAMAAGLPVVVTDWDGYKDTVRDGEDGFRIPTWMPAPGLGRHLALLHESGMDDYDHYCAVSCQAVAVDHQVLAERLTDLVRNPALRQRLGRQAASRARETFDWRVVFERYQALWADLDERRAHAQRQPPAWLLKGQAGQGAPAGSPPSQPSQPAWPGCDAARLDPFEAFASYPTHTLDLTTSVVWLPGTDPTAVAATLASGLFQYMMKRGTTAQAVQGVVAALTTAPSAAPSAARAGTGERAVGQDGDAAPPSRTVRELVAALAPIGASEVITAVAMLMKIGAVLTARSPAPGC